MDANRCSSWRNLFVSLWIRQKRADVVDWSAKCLLHCCKWKILSNSHCIEVLLEQKQKAKVFVGAPPTMVVAMWQLQHPLNCERRDKKIDARETTFYASCRLRYWALFLAGTPVVYIVNLKSWLPVTWPREPLAIKRSSMTSRLTGKHTTLSLSYDANLTFSNNRRYFKIVLHSSDNIVRNFFP